ncbi:peptide/nickel transport system substrate-binding protein [Kibdelosporangium banguiense]|uniref:Peptide/nickel transport system substrate-binding protein n=1 Tax=Kibdelosporangium banguiense TaxID=1365924 RepID=A0ABS4TXU9_9PSEU|nr:ABC transporter substrate-binding protein [Kibdelosporangium banguiense]MBP2329203.1 peptide/nickel transport system substrate-binding protein [Kibdelosporangium banguiense]
MRIHRQGRTKILRNARTVWTAGAIGVLVITSVTACGTSSGDGPTTTAISLTSTTPAATGAVDKVTWALPAGEPTTLDPAKAGDYSPNTVTVNLCESLLRLKPDFSAGPGLAESYTQPDPHTIVFRIRSGVKFWDDTPLTAADVTYSLRRNMDPEVGAVTASGFHAVTSIEASGPLEVTVRLSVPDAQFVNNMAGLAGAVSQQKFAEKAGRSYGTAQGGLMCTGPFSFGSWTPGDSIVIKRNDAYWDPALKPKAAQFSFRFVTDPSTLTSALVAGEIDGTYEAPVASLDALRASSGKVYFGPSTQSMAIGPATDSGPAADPRIRTAIDLAVDKTAIIKTALRGAGAPQKTFTPRLVWDASPARKIYEDGYAALEDTSKPNLDKAKQLVAEVKPTRPLVLAIGVGSPALTQTATIVQASAKQAGLDIEIKQLQPVEFSELFYDPSRRQGIDLVGTIGYLEVPGALSYAPLFTLPGGLFNWNNYHDAGVTAEIEAASAATDPAKTAEHFVKAQAIYAPARLQVTLANVHEVLYLNNRITGPPSSFAYISSPWAASVGAAS